MSFGITDLVRSKTGVDHVVHKNSIAYYTGTALGLVHSVVTGKAVGNAFQAWNLARATESVEYVNAVGRGLRAAQIARNVSNGAAAEARLVEIVWGTRAVRLATSAGTRIVDVLDEEDVAHEAKVGYTTLSPFVKRKIAKDALLLAKNRVKGVIWHFFESPVTGRIGASKPVLDGLAEAKIPYVFNK